MKRIHFFEIEDQSWCPNFIRRYVTDFLSTVIRITNLMQPTIKVLNDIIKLYPKHDIIVLGAGSGGGILEVASSLPHHTKIILTDLYPQNVDIKNPQITYWPKSVDATVVPSELKGIRVMYNSFHHLNPVLAKMTLANAVKENQPIVIFEGTERSVKGLLACLFIPLMVLLLTPFTKPFGFLRLFLTYIIPILPIIIFFDGVVSSLRTYSIEEAKALVADMPEFNWEVKILLGPKGERIFTLIGCPHNSKL